MRVAIIDLGTNTFNLLIAELFQNKIKRLVNTKISVMLGKGGIDKGIIQSEAMIRAVNAIAEHCGVIQSNKVDKILAYGTSALRTALNTNIFLEEVKKKFNLDISVISGDEEAYLIYKGILQTIPVIDEEFLTLDIGGGSNEFILANKNEIIWKQSFPLGMARIIEKFSLSDPIHDSEVRILEAYFEKELQPLFRILEKKRINYLVGAEGAFETFINILEQHLCVTMTRSNRDVSQVIEMQHFKVVHELLVSSSAVQRFDIKGIELFRMEMIVPASIFVNFLIKRLSINNMYVSPYSLKEGAAREILFS